MKKVWLVIYTFAVYRAVYFDLITLILTELFLQSLRRFVCRRGRPSTIHSDCGTNLTRASGAMNELYWDAIHKYSTVDKIAGKFNLPIAAWWSGWWERVRTLDALNYEELLTSIFEAETIVNSRSLTCVFEDQSYSVSLQFYEKGASDLDEVNSTSFK